jgi:hypothetical protein
MGRSCVDQNKTGKNAGSRRCLYLSRVLIEQSLLTTANRNDVFGIGWISNVTSATHDAGAADRAKPDRPGVAGRHRAPGVSRALPERSNLTAIQVGAAHQAPSAHGQGVLVRNGATTLTKLLTEIHVPPTVHGILASRIEALPASEKDLLQTLAVIGKASR